MNEQATIVAKRHSTGASQDAPSRGELDREMQERSFRNLSVAAIVYASVYFFAFTTGWLTHVLRTGAFHWPDGPGLGFTIGSLSFSIAVAIVARRGTLQPASFVTLAQWFLVVTAFGIAGTNWGWEQDIGEGRFFLVGVHWIGLWIAIYPNIVTLAPRNILPAALGAAFTMPAVAITSAVVNGLPPVENAGSIAQNMIVELFIPILICVGIAYAAARRVYCMARDVSRARRLGSYQLDELIGEGGMGEVWRASHRMLARPAAIKLIRPEKLGQGRDASTVRTALRRFEREAQATAALTSPHTIELYDFGITEDGTFYYVMELMRGLDLKSLVEDTGPVLAPRTVHFLRQACRSLADAHRHGMIHRDVKPANLYTCRRGLDYDFVKVLDFGLVKDADGAEDHGTQLTIEGIASGTPAFMAPEMVSGDGNFDERVDIYALGCVGYWLLTGTLVFEARSAAAVLIKHAAEEPVPVSERSELEIPGSLERIIHDCLAKKPDDRPHSMLGLSARLETVEQEIGSWTQPQAERWWRAHLPELAADPVSEHARPVTAG